MVAIRNNEYGGGGSPLFENLSKFLTKNVLVGRVVTSILVLRRANHNSMQCPLAKH